MMGFGDDSGIAAGPYANNLHLAPDRKPHQHVITQFYRPGAFPDDRPTVSKAQSTEGKPVSKKHTTITLMPHSMYSRPI